MSEGYNLSTCFSDSICGRLPGLLLAISIAWSPCASWAAEAAGEPETRVVAQALLHDGAYEVGEGDVLAISVLGEDDLTGEYKITTRGNLNFPLLGRVDIGGRTVEEVADHLEALLGAKYLVNPVITVQIAVHGSQPVQVLGAVGEPGVFHLERPTSLLEILALAGGIVSEKSIKEIQVKRTADSGTTITVVNLDRLLAQGEGNMLLAAGDTVNVVEGMVVYVSGRVEKSGAVPFRDGMTVSRALAEAGGPKTYANLREAYIFRDGERITVNLKRIMKGRAEDFPLKPGDQLVLQESMF